MRIYARIATKKPQLFRYEILALFLSFFLCNVLFLIKAILLNLDRIYIIPLDLP